MATVFMKWLETSPKDYDRGIQLLTLGRITTLKETIVNEYILPDMHVLEIGCGTGTLTAMIAEKGAVVTAIDASPMMFAEAQKKISTWNLEERVTLKFMDATLLGETFPPDSFDLIISTLVFSELPSNQQSYVLEACLNLLAPGGHLLIADEVIPSRLLQRLLYTLIRWPLVLITWLLTRTTTHALRGFDKLLTNCGFHAHFAQTYLGGSLVLYEAIALDETESAPTPLTYPRIHHQVTLRTMFIDLWELFFRIIPPYPKVRTGLYR
ncbi:MAG: class I SAM-dependent methyltransferase, partial [Anaerolineales bacterium]|nr:class I SAM-dependent methyltransferase [Anaerolineales bacterium]